MRYKTFSSLFLAFLVGLPAMAQELIVLPLPDATGKESENQKMRFRPVYLGTGPNLLASREFVMGDRSGGNLMEPLVPVRIGGSFLVNRPDFEQGKDWCYFLGEMEVTEAQWDAVMEVEQTSNSSLPKTKISHLDVQTFLAKYNKWLRSDPKFTSKLPSNDGVPGFLRLPSEEEWEFACRGGDMVSLEQFDQQIPYSSFQELRECEWVAESDASSGNLKPVTSGKANSAGFLHMMGNASEMTGSRFQLNYGSGRTGGYVVRGGSVNDSGEFVRSSYRFEKELYRKDGNPTLGRFLSFRIAIGSNVFWNSQMGAKLNTAAESTPREKTLPRASRKIGESSSDSTAADLARAETRIKSLKSQVEAIVAQKEKQKNQSTAKQTALELEREEQIGKFLAQIELLRADLENAESIVYERDRIIALALVKSASRAGAVATFKHEKFEELMEEKYRDEQTINELIETRDSWFKIMEESLGPLAGTNEQIRDQAFGDFRESLIGRGYKGQANQISYLMKLSKRQTGASFDKEELSKELLELLLQAKED